MKAPECLGLRYSTMTTEALQLLYAFGLHAVRSSEDDAHDAIASRTCDLWFRSNNPEPCAMVPP